MDQQTLLDLRMVSARTRLVSFVWVMGGWAVMPLVAEERWAGRSGGVFRLYASDSYFRRFYPLLAALSSANPSPVLLFHLSNAVGMFFC